MNDDQFAFFQRLVETTGPSGYETNTQRVWRDRIEGAAQQLESDALGNAIAILNPTGRPRVMIDAHIDEIGFIVKYIDDNGFIYFNTIGGFDPSTLAGNRVRIMGKTGPVMGVLGRKPIHLIEPDERKKAPELKSMWIDIGASGRTQAEELVGIGDAGGRAAGMTRLQNNIVASNSLDDRVGGYVMAEAFNALAQAAPAAAVYAASSVQEEIGLRGAHVTSYDTDAEIGIALEVTWTSDHPQATKTELGDSQVASGPVIFRGANINPRVAELLMKAADDEGVPYQVDIYAGGSPTDANAMQMSRKGMAVGIMSVPTRYLHTASEVASLDDIDAAVQVLTRFVRDLTPEVNLIP
ncbi:MAG: M20/M25/M40 family metallo-hydrolase [Chloroflexota bacterium]